jgi:hypothetical protein
MIVQSPAPPNSGVYEGSNTFATVEPGEPSQGGRMNKTCWALIKPTDDSRIVLNTFGSAFDTVLAVYTGSALDDLKKVAFNDNFSAPGTGKKASLVAFDAKKGKEYHIQIGSKTADTGDFYLNVFVLPPGGGLSAYLSELDFSSFRQPWFGGDYDCVISSAGGSCPGAVFILYNGTDKTLTVEATSDLGRGVRKPRDLTLSPGEAASARFELTAGFDKTKTRTVSGHFSFTGREGGNVIGTAQHPALIVVNGSAGQPDVLTVDVTPTIRAGFLNEPLTFAVQLENTGAETAAGCHVRRSDTLDHLRLAWSKPGRKTAAPDAPGREPFSIGPGKKVKLDLTITSVEERIADPEFPLNLDFDCANTASAPLDLSNAFDFTAFARYRPAQMELTKLAPKGDTLDVPENGTGTFRASAINRSPAANLRVIPIYLRPFSDCCDPNLQFTVEICRATTATGACLAPFAGSVEYTAAEDEESFFKVRIGAPQTDPGFDPGARRVVIKFWQMPPEGGVLDAVVGAESVAVRRR